MSCIVSVMGYTKNQMIDAGDTRKVYNVPSSSHGFDTEAVLKKGSLGINYKEIQTWEYVKSSPELKSQFARIYDYADDYSWILMERVDIEAGNVEQIDRQLLTRNGYNIGIIKDENVGLSERGCTVLVDYPYGKGS